jgi:ubiquinone/menaquinone biosynthesis C-methylase UbiE
MTTERCDRDALAAVYAEGADAYDEVWSPVIIPPAESVIRTLDLRGAERVLDVGAGTGALTDALRSAAPDALVVSIDASGGMLRYAHDRRVAIAVLGDAAAVSIASASVDAVLLAYVLFHLPEPIAALREATRVLRPGGHVGTVTWALERPMVASQVCNETLDELGVAALPAHGNYTGLDTEKAVEGLLAASGLRPQQVWREPVTHTFTPERFWRMRTGCGTNRARLAQLDEGRLATTLVALRDRLAGLQVEDYEFSGEVICARARKPGG